MSASSEVFPIIRLFIGTAPLDSDRTKTEEADGSVQSGGGQATFRSAIMHQEANNFCLGQKCYRNPWRVQDGNSKLLVHGKFYLDGTVSRDELQNYFSLRWTRQPA